MARRAEAVMKQLSGSALERVATQFAESLKYRKNYKVIEAWQLMSSTDVQDEFEKGRTELEAQLAPRGRKLITRQLWSAPPDEHYDSVVHSGLFGTFKGSAPTFFEDPSRALAVAPTAPRRMFLCRCALGVQDADWRQSENGAVVISTRTALPSFVVSWAMTSATASSSSGAGAGAGVAGGRVCPSCHGSVTVVGAAFCDQCGSRM